MKLIVAEKPSVGSSIAKVVGANTKENGCISGNGYIVSWCVGHLVGLCNADDYDPKYQKWDIKDLPIIPTTWKTKVLKNTTKQFAILKKLMNDKRVDELICATDAGREGELIFKLVYDKIACKKPVKRLWISSMEDKAIKEGMQNLKDASFYHNTYLSAMARAKSDWLIGINATRFYSCLYNNKLRSVNVGRVMSPTLAMIVKRYQENTNFTSVPFFNIVAKNKDLEIKSIEKWDKKEEANNILSKISNSKLICTRKDIKQKEARSPLPYDLTTLQREANRIYGLSAQKTL
ncbi:MAG: DNA topoisomerase, partial [Ezakiella sp.]|nr:DNA topoisomerase [Ezakiella sp.]